MELWYLTSWDKAAWKTKFYTENLPFKIGYALLFICHCFQQGSLYKLSYGIFIREVLTLKGERLYFSGNWAHVYLNKPLIL